MPTVCSLKRAICHHSLGSVIHAAGPAWGLGTCSVPIMGSFYSFWMLQTQFLGSSCLSPPLATACHLSKEESQLSVALVKCKESVSQIKLCHVSLRFTLVGQSEEAQFLIQRPQGIISEKGFVKGQWGDQLRHTTNTKGLPWVVKNPPAIRETWVLSLGWEDPLERGKATQSSILAWRIPWTV